MFSIYDINDILLLIPFIEINRCSLGIVTRIFKKYKYYLSRTLKKHLFYLKRKLIPTWIYAKLSIISVPVVFFIVFGNFIPITTKHSDGFFTSLATIIGAILVLVPTLFLISIQKANDSWSFVIKRLYLRDFQTKIFFGSSGLSCVVYFTFTIINFSEDSIWKKVTLAISLLWFVMNLDFLIYYVAHVCRLLDPRGACDVLVKESKSIIKKLQSGIALYIEEQSQGKTLTKEQIEKLEKRFYEQLPEQQERILVMANEGAAEMAYKATTTNDNISAKAAIKSLTEIIEYYLQSRKQNTNDYINFFQGFPCITTDLDKLLNPIFEALKRINLAALKNENEEIIIAILTAYARLVRVSASPLMPLHFFMQCIQKSFDKELIDAPFQGTEILLNLAYKAKAYQNSDNLFSEENEAEFSIKGTKERRLVELYSKIFDNILQITVYLSKKSSELSHIAFERACQVLSISLDYIEESLNVFISNKKKLNSIQIDSLEECFKKTLERLMSASELCAALIRTKRTMLLNSPQFIQCPIFRKLSSCFEKVIELAELTHDTQKTIFYDKLLIHVGEEIFEQLNTKMQKEQPQSLTNFPFMETKTKADFSLEKINVIQQTAIDIKTQIDGFIKRLADKGILTNEELDELSENFSYLIKK